MDESLAQLLAEIEAFGAANDRRIPERPMRMLNVTRETGEFLAVLVRAANARRVLEIGTSNGYSTLWLASAADAIGGTVTTVERSDYKLGLARANFARAAVARSIELLHADAGAVLRGIGPGRHDLVFLDSERAEYIGWWPDVKRVLRAGGLLVVDNATSHAEELAPFVTQVRADAAFSACVVPVGNGEFLAVKEPADSRRAEAGANPRAG
jgi:predicted O-methyltransferase YrrM